MIDFSKAQKRMQVLQSKKRDYSRISYSLKEGKNELRFVTLPGEDWPFKYGAMYYKIQKQYFVAPEDGQDPILQNLNALMKSGNQENAVFAKKHFPSKRVFALVLVRGAEDKGLVWVDFPPKIEKQLVGFILNEDYGDITDIENGRDFTIIKTKGSPYPEYSVQPKGKTTPLLKDKETSEALFNDVPEFKIAYKHLTVDEMKEAWDKYLNGDENKETETIEEPIEEEKIDIGAALAKFKEKKLKNS